MLSPSSFISVTTELLMPYDGMKNLALILLLIVVKKPVTLLSFRHRQAVEVGEQPVPISVAVGRGLHMAGLVGQDALGGGQGHRVFVDDGVVGAGFAVFGHLEQGIDAAGGAHHVIGGAPEPRQRMQLVVGQHGEGLRMGGGLPVQHIEYQRRNSLASVVRENMAIRWAPRRENIRTSFSLLPLPNPLTVKLTVKVMQGVNSSALRV